MQNRALLNDRSVLAISGQQASSFLQGLITNDMVRLETEKAIYAALLTPQGKILFDFMVIKASDDKFYIDCAATQQDDLVRRLALYRLRAKVEIAETPFAVAAAWGGENLPALSDDILIFGDPRLPELGLRAIAPAEILKNIFPGDEGSYRAHRLGLGVPDSADLPADSVFALDAGFEELNGVSFSKGCFVGQEVTSRMKHRASARKRFLIVEMSGICPQGTPLKAGGQEIGMLGTGDGNIALALMRLDRVSNAEQTETPITCAGKPVILTAPKWHRI
jgi:hypothetical protein